MEKMDSESFFELLCKNDPDELSDFLISYGKGPKPICPIQFITEDKNDEKEC